MALGQLMEAEARLKQQAAAYEAVRADRNLASRNLIAAQDEALELQNKAKLLVPPFGPLDPPYSSCIPHSTAFHFGACDGRVRACARRRTRRSR